MELELSLSCPFPPLFLMCLRKGVLVGESGKSNFPQESSTFYMRSEIIDGTILLVEIKNWRKFVNEIVDGISQSKDLEENCCWDC